jgi:hypothetical protein
MRRVQTALAAGGELAQVRGESEVIASQNRQALWTVEAVYDVPADSVRTSFEKAPGSTLDIQDQRIELQTGRDVYEAYPGTDDPVNHYTRDNRPACYPGEPELLVMSLLCGLGPLESRRGDPKVDAVNHEGRPALAVSFEDADGRTVTLFVDRRSYLPLAHTVTFQGGSPAQTGVFRTTYSVSFVSRASVPAGFFDPRALGYVLVEEQWLAILDTPALGVPVYWPGRALSGTGGYDATLKEVEDRRGPPGSGPGTVFSLVYQGAAGAFSLDYWPPGAWEAFESLLGQASIWAKCSEHIAIPGSTGQATIRRGFEPPAPYLPAPRQPGQAPPPLPDVFPDGCPARAYDRFMAVIQRPDVTITVNASLALCCQDGASFGAFDTEAGLEAIIARLRLRLPGE